MSFVVIVTQPTNDQRRTQYLYAPLAETWRAEGHHVDIASNVDRLPDADVALLHVDLYVVPGDYVRAILKYPVVINGAALDIRKRRVRRQLCGRDDAWSGPVIVKTDLNAGGSPERRALTGSNASCASGALTLEHDVKYRVYRDLDAVPDSIWLNDNLVVERYLPERAGLGYYVYSWIFFGAREQCVRRFGYRRILKGHNTVHCRAAEVPHEMRAERERLGFDYGKFDFVFHDKKAVLLDANKTPALGSQPQTALHQHLAPGINSFLRMQSGVSAPRRRAGA